MTSPDLTNPNEPGGFSAVERKFARLGIREIDLEEKFARSSGPGGQNVNKVSTCVTLKHLPSGISVTVQDSRSQHTNRRLARERLAERITQIAEQALNENRAVMEKKRRQAAKRPGSLKRQILKAKKHRGAIKKNRSRVTEE